MALEVAGKKPIGKKKLKIENKADIDLPKKTIEHIQDVFDFLPVEHVRGLERMQIVDFISDPRIKDAKVEFQGDLPGLYHPKVQNKGAWMEVSVGALLKPFGKWTEKWMAKTSFKSNLAGLIFSLVGQHYFMTMKHSVKKQNLEPQIRQYAEKQLKRWSESRAKNTWRGRLFAPLRPIFERWAKWLNKKAKK
ncbi:MAG: hypothetical protein HKN33_09885 [Pyrinomonadaceae bacterium]|nr:hypothetical protein [Pyrinomonadaceae bacterium]